MHVLVSHHPDCPVMIEYVFLKLKEYVNNISKVNSKKQDCVNSGVTQS